MINRLIWKAMLVLLIVSGITAIIHYFYLEYGIPEHLVSNSYWYIYMFLVPIALLGYIFVAIQVKIDPKSGGINVMVFSVLKMIMSLMFLMPWIVKKTEISKPFAMQFMALYFIILAVETVLFVKLVEAANKKD